MAKEHIGHELAEKCADKAGDEWRKKAMLAFVRAAKTKEIFTTGSVRRDVEEMGYRPHDSRAWGAIARRALKDGIVVHTGRWETSGSHQRADAIWKSNIYKKKSI